MNHESNSCVCTNCEAERAGFASPEDLRKALDFDRTLAVVVFLGIILLLSFGISRL